MRCTMVPYTNLMAQKSFDAGALILMSGRDVMGEDVTRQRRAWRCPLVVIGTVGASEVVQKSFGSQCSDQHFSPFAGRSATPFQKLSS